MAVPPAPRSPTNRWPSVLLALGLLILVVAAMVFLLARPGTSVNVGIAGTPAGPRDQGPPPTLAAPPSAVASASSPTPTAAVLVTPVTPTPSATATPTPAASALAAPSQPAAATAPPTPRQATPSATAAPTVPPAVGTPAAGQVSPPGGLGNTEEDVQAADGPPTGETPRGLVVYRKASTEYRVGYTVAPRRSLLVAQVPPQNAPMTFDAARAASRNLIPFDTQPRAPQPEGNSQFIVERFTSPSLAHVVPPGLVGEVGVSPGDFVIAYARNGQGAITRIVVGAGDDPNALLDRSQ